MDVTEWLAMILAIGGGAAALYGPVSALRGRRHLRCIDTRISCPQSGADVDCTLVRDGRTSAYTEVEACSASNVGGRPSCGQDCVRILNRDIPLFPREGARNTDPEPSRSMG